MCVLKRSDMFLVLLIPGLLKLMFCGAKQKQMAVGRRFEHLDPVYRASNSSSEQRETLMNHNVISIKVSCVVTSSRETCFHPPLDVKVHESVKWESRAAP